MLRLAHRIRSALWLVPLLFLVGGVGLSFATIAIDRSHDYDLVSKTLTGSPQAAQSALQLIAESAFTLASLVLSLTLVAVQLAMGQFSPRIVRALLSDRRSQVSIGLFLATFAYAALAMRQVDDESGDIAGLTVVTAYGLALLSIIGLVFYIHAAAQSLRVAGLIDLVGDETRKQLEDLYPPSGADSTDPNVIEAPEPGVVVALDRSKLIELARAADCTLELVPAIGDFALAGAPLLRVEGDAGRLDRDAAVRAIVLGSERGHRGDASFGFRKLVDMAARSVTDPFDDPTTAVQAIDRLHDGLRQLSGREFPSGRHEDAGGQLRLVIRELRWEGYVRLAFDEVRLAGAGSPQVARRLMAALEDLLAVAPEERRAPLERQRELLEAAVRREFEDDADVEAALTPDVQGIGSGRDVMG